MIMEEVNINKSVNTIMEHLDVMSSEQLSSLMTQIGFELMDRDAEFQARAQQDEQEFKLRNRQNGELVA
jgi:hypothetical protein